MLFRSSTKQIKAAVAIAKRHGLPEAMHIGASASTGHRWALDEDWIKEYVRGGEGHVPCTVPLVAEPAKKENGRKRASLPSAVRMAVWNKHFGREAGVGECYCCGEQIFQQAFECGHVLAAAKGGSDAVDNLRPLCSICNKSQGDDHMDDFMSVYFPNVRDSKKEPRARIKAKRTGVAPMAID